MSCHYLELEDRKTCFSLLESHSVRVPGWTVCHKGLLFRAVKLVPACGERELFPQHTGGGSALSLLMHSIAKQCGDAFRADTLASLCLVAATCQCYLGKELVTPCHCA